jgi:hypothetical protein
MARYREIEISGEVLPIAFGMGVLLRYCRVMGVRFDDFAANIQEHLENPDCLEQLVFAGFVQGHRIAKKEIAIELEDVLNVDAVTYSKYVQMIAEGINGDGGNPEAALESGNGKKSALKKVKA